MNDRASTGGAVEFETLASGLYLEGLAVDGDSVWYSDVIAGGVHRWSADRLAAVLVPDRKWIGGVQIAQDGSILSTGQGGIMRSNPETGESEWLLHEADGAVINGINEFVPDGRGGYYFGGCDLDAVAAARRPDAVSICHVSPSGDLRTLCDGLGFTNGLALSGDGARLYCNESFDGTYVHDVVTDGSLSNRRLFLKKPDCDGMALDAAGNVWITGFSSSHIERVAPDGTVLDRFETPAEAITQCRFGGADMRTLYIVTVPKDAGANLAAGRMPERRNSHLVRVGVDTPGQVIPKLPGS
jgi:sugar lactone lactonase YvrE